MAPHLALRPPQPRSPRRPPYQAPHPAGPGLRHPLLTPGPPPTLLHPQALLRERRPPRRHTGRLALLPGPQWPSGARLPLRLYVVLACEEEISVPATIAAIAAAACIGAALLEFSSTLRVASFGGCGFAPENGISGLHFPLLKQLSLMSVQIPECSLYALLAACPVLQSLMLSIGCSRIRIVSRTLRRIGLDASWGDVNRNVRPPHHRRYTLSRKIASSWTWVS